MWEQETQWEPLWEDVRDAAEDYLDGNATPHFMGAVVLQQHPNSSSEVQTRIVVDGQQRLTTMQLLLDPIQEVFQQRGYSLPDLSNYSWAQKRQQFQTFSTLYPNKDILDQTPDAWDETAIAERAHRLYIAAIKVWPHADGIRQDYHAPQSPGGVRYDYHKHPIG